MEKKKKMTLSKWRRREKDRCVS